MTIFHHHQSSSTTAHYLQISLFGEKLSQSDNPEGSYYDVIHFFECK